MPIPLILSDPVCIVPAGDWCGEGILWHPAEQAVYWTDINRFLIHRWDSTSKSVTTWQFGEPVTALSLTTTDELLVVVLGSRVVLWKPAPPSLDPPEFETIYRLPEWPAVRCNDARVDPSGILWVATMQNNVAPDGSSLPVAEALGGLFSLNRSGAVKYWRKDLFIGNTLAWSPDSRFFYTADTLADSIVRFDWHEDSSLSNESPWFKGDGSAGSGLPDGSAMDSEGYLWNSRYGGGRILRIAPSGEVESTVSMPVQNPTTCIFGGPDNTTLFVTSAALGDDLQLAGGLFAIRTSITGPPPGRFQL